MKLWIKIVIGIAIALVALAIISNIGKDKTEVTTEIPSTPTSTPAVSDNIPTLPSTPGTTLNQLQAELNTLETQINNLASEDLAGLE